MKIKKRMIRMYQFIFWFYVLLAGTQVHADQTWQVAPLRSEIRFMIHSTLHDVEGQARDILGSFKASMNSTKGFVVISVMSLTTNNPARDKDMVSMFNAPQNPQINFIFDNTDMSSGFSKTEGEIVFLGIMTMHNISRAMTFTAKTHRNGNVLICEGQFNIHLKDFDLKPPSVLGIIRVNNLVNVRYKIYFTNQGGMK